VGKLGVVISGANKFAAAAIKLVVANSQGLLTNFPVRVLRVNNPTEWTSRLAGGAAVLVASLTGLVAVWIFPERLSGADGKVPVELAGEAEIDFTGTEIGRVISFCARHTTSERGFVVFRNGTCVIIRDLATEPVAQARRLLKEAATPDAKFLSERTAEGDLIATFTGPVFHWIPSDQLSATTVWANGNLDALFSENERKMAKENWMPPQEARLGLVARHRLLEDGNASEVVKIILPKPASISR
jgi:hypothetical protein